MLSLLRIFACLLLSLQPALSSIYTDLASSLGTGYRYLSRDSNLTVSSPAASIRTQDFSEIFVWDANTLFVGAENYILKMDSNLVIETTYSVDYDTNTSCIPMSDIFLCTCENYFRVFLNINNALYTCYTNRSADPVCVALDPVTLAPVSSPALFNQGNAVDEGFISPTQPTLLYQRNFAIYVVDTNNNSRLITGSVYDDSYRNRITVINPFQVGTGSSPYITTTFYYFENPTEVQKFFFAASFSRTAHNYVNSSNNYIYFMFYEPSNSLISGLAISRVGRFCLQGPSDPDSEPNTLKELPQMESFIKGELQCGTVFPSLVQDWLYVSNGSDYLYYAVFSSLGKGPQTSYLCIYSLSAIRAEMDMIKTCTDDMRLETKDPVTPISGGPSLGHVGGLFTQLQRYTIVFSGSSYEMIYVSLSNGSLIKYCLSCPTDLQLVQLMQVVPNKLINASLPELSALDRLQLSGEFLLAGGYTGLYRVPLQTCAALGAKFTECLRDPMCYFDLNTRLCEAVTPGTTNSSSILHFSEFSSSPLPPVPSCWELTGTLYVSTVSQSTALNYSWTCAADFVTIVISYSNGSNDTFLHDNTAGNQSISLTYFFLNETLVTDFQISPFYTYNSIPRALPGPALYSYVTYNVTQPSPLLFSCLPLPPICSPPVCADLATCSDYCSQVNISCPLSGSPCADEIFYTLNEGPGSVASDPSLITVSYSDCSEQGCLFQAYSRNTTANTTATGSSLWLHLIAPLRDYTPVLTVDRVPAVYNKVEFSTRFAEFSIHTCAAPTILTDPPSSPYTLLDCRQNFTAYATGTDSFKNVTVELYSSQQVLPPVSVQLTITTLSDIDVCSFSADVTVSWQHPSYVLTGAGLEYSIRGYACGGDSGITVKGSNNYTCQGVTLSYNTLYSVYVTSYEPCFKKAAASATANTRTILAPPSGPRGLGYQFYTDQLMVTWSPPICVNSYASVLYCVTVYRSPCNNNSSTLIQNTTGTYTNISIPLISSNTDTYTIIVIAKAGAVSSEEASITAFSPVGAEFYCDTCRVHRVTIDSTLSDISWTTTPGCDSLAIDSFSISLWLNTNQLLTSTILPGTASSLPAGYNRHVVASGTYTVSVSLSLKQDCSSVACVSEETKAFIFYWVHPGGAAPLTSLDTMCQDDKAYIILGLAAVAIACAVGNLGFMLVAFCVFCVPRKKVLCC